MARTFNCSIGMVVVVGVDEVQSVIAAIEGTGEKVFRIGSLVQHVEGTPVVTLENLEKMF